MHVSAHRSARRLGTITMISALAFGSAPLADAQQLDPNIPLTEAPAPAILPTEPNFDYFNLPRDTTGCPFATTPPPVVDESEVPLPGQVPPAPPEVPAEPAGGQHMAGCEPIAADGLTLPANLTASSWILVDAHSRKVLATKDPHGRYRPASIIKVLLALVVLDELDLQQPVTISDADIAEAEGTLLGIGPGGQYTIEQLLAGMLLLSGNDAAYSLAAQLGGVDSTLEKMNAKCAQLGCTDTNASSVSGLDKPGNMTSAYDMALVFSAALEHDVFRTMISTPRIGFPGYPANEFSAAPDPDTYRAPGEEEGPPLEVPGADGVVHHGDGTATAPNGEMFRPGFVIYNDNKLLASYEGALGGKTGFTDDARQTFIGAAEREGRRLFVVLLDGTAVPQTPSQQTAALLDAGFGTDADTEGVGSLVGTKEDAANAAGTVPDRPSSALAEEGLSTAQRWTIAGGLLLALAVVVAFIVRPPRASGTR